MTARKKAVRAKKHPVFGGLDAQGWHCLFGRHLESHRKQAGKALELLHAQPA